MRRAEKVENVGGLQNDLGRATLAVLAEYRGLTAGQMNKFRRAVREVKAGKVEFRVEKAGIVHVAIGKRSFGADRLIENAHTLLTSLLRAKPAAAKGNYMQSVAVATTMGPGVRVDPATARAA